MNLVNFFTKKFGTSRLPMLVIDSEKTINDRSNFSARTAAINGFGIFSVILLSLLPNPAANRIAVLIVIFFQPLS